MIGPHSYLQKEEIAKVLNYLHARHIDREFKSNLAIFRLSCCCGLRTVEISGLELRDFNFNAQWPGINIRAEITKGKNGKREPRFVPLWWDKASCEDLKDFWHYRMANSKSSGTHQARQPYICGLRFDNYGKRLLESQIAKKWITSLKGALGEERTKQLSIHRGRDTFISWALASGRSVKEVGLAVGHKSIKSTDVYTHAVDTLKELPDLFGGESIAGRSIAPVLAEPPEHLPS